MTLVTIPGTSAPLHLLNGDCALEAWPQEWREDRLVWRENYLLGPLPETDDLTEFSRERVEVLHRSAPERDKAGIFAELQAMHQTLLARAAAGPVRLWFDRCPFDRVMLARILRLLSDAGTSPEILLTWEDVVWDTANFRRFRCRSARLTTGDLAYGAAQWEGFRRHRIAPDRVLENLPYDPETV